MDTLRFSGLIMLLVSAACAADTRAVTAHQRAPEPKPTPARSAPAARVTAARSDAQIEADIRARLAKSKINADKFTVHVQGGVATIEGHTDVIQHKGVATRLARNAGAAAVNNRIQISDAARQKAAGNLEQGRRRAQLKRGDSRSERR